MNKTTFIILIVSSLLIRVVFACVYPLTADELNFWNYFHDYPKFTDFWQFFTKFDTQQPLFHLLWFPVFKANWPVIALRLPSVLLSAIGMYFWNKLFNYKDEDNSFPWILFLFAPFLTIYSVFFLPYSLLITTSVINFYFFRKLDSLFNRKNLMLFLASSVLLSYTHYFGALQAIVLSLFFVLFQKNRKVQLSLLSAVIVIFILLITTTDFLNDLIAKHTYRNPIHLLDILGHFNLLIGGKFVAMLLALGFLYKKKWITLKNINTVFIITIVLIAYLKSILLSPSLEARYLLILIYPIYFLTKGLKFKYSTPLLVTVCLISLGILQKTYGPAFVTDYSVLDKDGINTGLLITPCPKFYFRGDNYICKYEIQSREQLKENIDKMIINIRHMPLARNMDLFNECKDIGQDLFSCNLK